jgi:hypothetical protein
MGAQRALHWDKVSAGRDLSSHYERLSLDSSAEDGACLLSNGTSTAAMSLLPEEFPVVMTVFLAMGAVETNAGLAKLASA